MFSKSTVFRLFSAARTASSHLRPPRPLSAVQRRLASSESEASSSSVAAAASNPLECSDFFGVHRLFTVEDLFSARVHLGHASTSVDPRMRDFVFGARFGTSIIDLDQTAVLLRQALNFLSHVTSRGGIVLFCVRQPHLVHMVESAAEECGEYAHCRPWDSKIFTAPQDLFQGEIR